MKKNNSALSIQICIFLFILFASCKKSENNPDAQGHRMSINTVQLTFTPIFGTDSRTFTYFDPDGPGGQLPQVEGIELMLDTTYSMEVDFFHTDDSGNRTSLTGEVLEQSNSHLVCFDFNIPAQNTLAEENFQVGIDDMDFNQDPLGLSNTVWARSPAGGDDHFFSISLRHGISKIELGPWCAYDVETDIEAIYSIIIQ